MGGSENESKQDDWLQVEGINGGWGTENKLKICWKGSDGWCKLLCIKSVYELFYISITI